MTPLVERALLDTGLLEVLAARRAGHDCAPFARRLEHADLIALGALADVVREQEVGPVVHLRLDQEPPEGAFRDATIELLRAVAIARLVRPRAARVCVDFAVSGLELAQVALSFGADELAGPIANRRGLPIAEEASKKVKGKGQVALRALKQEEIVLLVRRAGREPVLI